MNQTLFAFLAMIIAMMVARDQSLSQIQTYQNSVQSEFEIMANAVALEQTEIIRATTSWDDLEIWDGDTLNVNYSVNETSVPFTLGIDARRNVRHIRGALLVLPVARRERVGAVVVAVSDALISGRSVRATRLYWLGALGRTPPSVGHSLGSLSQGSFTSVGIVPERRRAVLVAVVLLHDVDRHTTLQHVGHR